MTNAPNGGRGEVACEWSACLPECQTHVMRACHRPGQQWVRVLHTRGPGDKTGAAQAEGGIGGGSSCREKRGLPLREIPVNLFLKKRHPKGKKKEVSLVVINAWISLPCTHNPSLSFAGVLLRPTLQKKTESLSELRLALAVSQCRQPCLQEGLDLVQLLQASRVLHAPSANQ